MKLGPRISDTAATWLSAHFSTRNAGAEYILEAFPELYRRVLRDLKGRFTPGELSLLLDVMNGHMLTPQLAGQSLIISCVDSMALDGTDTKWGVDAQGFADSLQGCRPFELACLEIWAQAFWVSGAWERENGLSAAAAVMGRKGGSAKSARKTAAVRENARKGGRPKKTE